MYTTAYEPDQAQGGDWPEDSEIETSAGAAGDEDTEDFLSTTWDLLAVLAIAVLTAAAGIIMGLAEVTQHLTR